jgi:hypothetical protein
VWQMAGGSVNQTAQQQSRCEGIAKMCALVSDVLCCRGWIYCRVLPSWVTLSILLPTFARPPASCLTSVPVSYTACPCRWLDDVVIYVKNILPNCSLVGLEMVYNALPLLGSGYRLNEVRQPLTGGQMQTTAAGWARARVCSCMLLGSESSGVQGGATQLQSCCFLVLASESWSLPAYGLASCRLSLTLPTATMQPWLPSNPSSRRRSTRQTRSMLRQHSEADSI